jgi:DNA-binding response OmpR family regulator
MPVLKSHIAQRYFIRAEIYAVNDKLPSVNLQLHANGDILLGIAPCAGSVRAAATGTEMRESMYNILICDDEKDIVNALKIYLNDSNYHFLEAFDGEEAVHLVDTNEVHLVLMDIMMPKLDGIQAMIRIREKSNVPVILLTAKGEDSDKVLGLTVGADDYITKPFNPIEVSARVKSQLRRYMQLGGGSVRPDVIRVGGIELDDKEKRVTLDGEPVALTPTEYDILKLLMQNPGQVFSPREIYSKIWNDLPLGSENTVAVHIRHLREKLEINPAEPRYLKVVWGQGYKCEKQG